MVLDTPRLRLRCCREADRDAFAAMHADPDVMFDHGGPISRAASDAKLDRYAAAFHRYGISRCGLKEVLAYTGPANLRSQAVMARLRLQRDSARDFTACNDGIIWRGLVWVARRVDP